MTQAIYLEIQQTGTNRCFHLQLDPNINLQQLHNSILVLFGWKDEEPFSFKIHNQLYSWDDKNRYLPLHSFCLEDTFTYTYGDGVQKITLQLHAKTMKAVCQRHIECLDDTKKRIEHFNLQKDLDALSIDEQTSKRNFETLLEVVREQLNHVTTIAPCLFMFDQYGTKIPFYLDILDNGIELMIFPDEQSFVRSILNASGEDPDLLFTYAFTFDFLYEELEESDLPLYQGHNLCYKNIPGQLPQEFDAAEYFYAYKLLERLHYFLLEETHLPSFSDRQMVFIQQDGNYQIVPFQAPKEIAPLLLTSWDHAALSRIPHTNEHYRLMLQAMPRADSKETHLLDIKLCAINSQFHKEMSVTFTSLEELSEDIIYFMKQLFKERGLAEEIQLSSCNLYHLVSGICEQLNIHCHLYTHHAPCDLDASLIDMICDAMAISPEELLHIEAPKQPVSKLWN